MKAVTAAEMRKIDERAIGQYGIPGIVLMENAGVEAAGGVETALGDAAGKRVCIFAGKGNNGGDGFVAARHLHNRGARVKVFIVGAAADIQGDARTNLDILHKMNIEIVEMANERDWDKARIAMAFADCLIDALLGVGFKGALQPPMERIITMMNDARKLVIAIDIPSGVDADTGRVGAAAVRAAKTVVMALPKTGLLFYPGASHAGELLIADIGAPECLLKDVYIAQNITNTKDVAALLPRRAADAHKGSCGKALLVAGSRGLTGAAALAATAVLRSGAGLATLAVAESLHDIMEAKLTEVMTYPLPEDDKGVLGERSTPALLALAGDCDAVAIGPGLGRAPATAAMVREIVATVSRPLVIDADALYALDGAADLVKKAKITPVLTPHPGELSHLIGLTVEEIKEDYIYSARQAAEQFQSVVVLKGARSVIAAPNGEVFINVSGNRGMATGGTGDVLTGVIAGLLAQGLTPQDAAVAGVYLHGLAGDIVAQNGMNGMMAGDLLSALPAAIFGINA